MVHPAQKIAYSMKEVEQALGISHSKLYELISAGKLKTFEIGTRRLATPDALGELIADLESEAA